MTSVGVGARRGWRRVASAFLDRSRGRAISGFLKVQQTADLHEPYRARVCVEGESHFLRQLNEVLGVHELEVCEALNTPHDHKLVGQKLICSGPLNGIGNCSILLGTRYIPSCLFHTLRPCLVMLALYIS